MTLARIILNNTRQRFLSAVLTSLSVAVGVALIIAILTIKIVSQERLRLGYSGFDLVVGSKGSPLQLVLNVIYHLDTSPGNIPFSVYEKLKKDPRVKFVVPFSVGDNYQGFRIVGTTDSFLKKFEPRLGKSFEFAEGRCFEFEEADLQEAFKEAIHRGESLNDKPTHLVHEGHDRLQNGVEGKVHHHERSEAVLGATVAQETGLKIGNIFVATHGLQKTNDGEEHKDSPWTVVGILKPTGTPSDRTIYINLDSFYHIEGHVIELKKGLSEGNGHSEKTSEGDGDPEVGQISALALKARNFPFIWGLRKQINESLDAQAVAPAEEIRKLLTIVGNVDRILLAQAILIILVSALGTGLAMFNSMNDRRRDIAVMRALGAKRRTIVAIIVGEAVFIAGIGGIFGFIFGHLLIQASASAIQAAVGFDIPALAFHGFEIFVFIGVLVMGVLAGIGPAISAYRTDVATGLSPNA